MNSILPWLILLAPFVSAAVITLFTLRWKTLSSSISIVAVLVSFVCSCLIFVHRTSAAAEFVWIDISPVFRVPLGLTLDQLSRTMVVLVSGIGALIHIYSLGYMRDDDGKSRYFAALSLFMFAMLGIVLANNFVMLFIFWELVGFTSYVLIGHWFDRDAAADAANKAFITTRIGDFGFMLGILMVWMATGSVVFAEIAPRMSILASHPAFLTVVALLIFCGAVGKSAQFPLHVWLPDAMEGPTPVSALIHAATMVAAGVYMLVRVAFIIQASQTALLVIAWIGTITAVMAALIATQQNDIKRILAYSTLSQLGYMVMAVGLASNDAAMFHLFHSRVFQSAALPRRRLSHRHASSRTRHLENGRAFAKAADHIRDFRRWRAGVDRLPAVQRIFQQGRNSCARLRTQHADFRRGVVHGVSDSVLRHTDARHCFLRQPTQRHRARKPRITAGNDSAADRARAPGSARRICIFRAKLPHAPSRKGSPKPCSRARDRSR